MEIVYADIGEKKHIIRVGGKEESRKHLERLGFIPGSEIQVVSKIGENVILNIKNTRIAISKGLARKIFV